MNDTRGEAEAFLEQHDGARIGDRRLEIVAVAGVLLLAAIVIARCWSESRVVVLTESVMKGSPIASDALGLAPLPGGSQTFANVNQVAGIAARDLRAGTVLTRFDLVRSAPAASTQPHELEVPLRLAVDVPVRPGSTVILMVTRPNQNALMFEGVRVLTRDTSQHPSTITVAMKRAEAFRLVQALPAEIHLLK